MFEFKHIDKNDNGLTISARCLLSSALPFFKGHFTRMPILPAVGQIKLIEFLLQTQPEWHTAICGGKALKFILPLKPDDEISISLERTNPQSTISFSIFKDGQLASKGMLLTTDVHHG